MSSVLALHSSVIRPSIAAAMTQVQRPNPPASSRHYEHARAMAGTQSHSPEHASPPDSHDPDHDGDGEDEAKNGNSSNSDAGVARKRRRSRKGLDKKFACPQEGCGKSYSRAEHLYRHQLNHNPKQRYACEYPDCPRVFVRQDLCKRHMERHTAKGSALSRKDSLKDSLNRFPTISHENGQSYSAAPASPESNRPGTGYQQSRVTPVQYQSPKEASHVSPFTPIAAHPQTTFPHPPRRSGSDGYMPQEAGYHNEHRNSYQSPPRPTRPSVQTNAGPYGVLSPVSTQHSSYHSLPSNTPQSSTTVPYVSQQNFPPFSLPPSDFVTTPAASNPREQGSAYGAATTNDYNEHAHSQSNGEMMRLDQMTNQTTIPVFGSDGVLNKSPYISIPEDFITYLFNSGDGSPTMGHVVPPGQHSGYNDQQNQYGVTYYSEGGSLGYFPPPSNQPQQVMSVTNLLDQNLPESVLSEEKSHEIYDFIKERFHEKGHAPIEWCRDRILDGDRSDETHMLSRKMMQAYIGSYWLHFSDQMPILHKPSFSPGKTPNLLLMAVMAIGASCLDRSHSPQVTRAGAQLSNFLAWHLRWEIFQDPNFSPPAKLWVFQTLILLELYEKMYSTRQLHERAHIHHATTITLMRRGRSLIGRSALDSPPNPRDDKHGPAGSRQSSTSGLAPTPDDWWNHWIANEATRRAAFAAFLIDSIHATMFGHSTVMVAHEMRLPLPCDELLWNATSGLEVNRIEANLSSNGVKPISFLEGLKRTLSYGELQTNSFGRQILMAGLLNVSWHMNQRDLQLSSLGENLGGRGGKWRMILTKAFDHWKTDFDKFLQHSEVLSDPYSYEDRADAHLVFESRTVLHHLAHMAMHVDIVDCQIFARAKRLLGRAIGAQDLNSAQRRMKDNWAPSAMARDATCYALRFLHSVLVSDSAATPSLNGHGRRRQPYSARDDVLLNRPWVLYFAALVVWCYGYALEGPCPSVPLPSTPQETTDQMREYLQKFGLLICPSQLRSMTGVNRNSAMLKILKDSFETTRWELLHEGATLLSNCIQLNSGASGI